jgi:hypothetical protein
MTALLDFTTAAQPNAGCASCYKGWVFADISCSNARRPGKNTMP